MNPARRLFPIGVSPLSFAHLRFGIVNPYGTSCVSTSRSPRQFSHRQFGLCNPHRESACLLSEALGRSHIGILDLTTLTHLVRVDFRHSRTIRSSPFRAPLLTLVAEPPPAGSIWTSLLGLIWGRLQMRTPSEVHMDPPGERSATKVNKGARSGEERIVREW